MLANRTITVTTDEIDTPVGSMIAGLAHLAKNKGMALPEWAEEQLREIDHDLWNLIGDCEDYWTMEAREFDADE